MRSSACSSALIVSECAASPPVSRFLREREKLFALLGSFLCRSFFGFGRRERVVELDDGDVRPRVAISLLSFGHGSRGGGAAIICNLGYSDRFVRVALADVFVLRVVRDEAHVSVAPPGCV